MTTLLPEAPQTSLCVTASLCNVAWSMYDCGHEDCVSIAARLRYSGPHSSPHSGCFSVLFVFRLNLAEANPRRWRVTFSHAAPQRDSLLNPAAFLFIFFSPPPNRLITHLLLAARFAPPRRALSALVFPAVSCSSFWTCGIEASVVDWRVFRVCGWCWLTAPGVLEVC